MTCFRYALIIITALVNRTGRKTPTVLTCLLFQMTGTLKNNGHDITFYVRQSRTTRWSGANVTGGPLSYSYRVDQIKFHFGQVDSEGSEHSVGTRKFPVEAGIMLLL